MGHYEERLERDLLNLRSRVQDMGERVLTALENSIHAVLEHDHALASRTILGDLPINRASRSLDRLCYTFAARHLPSAGHLRFVTAVLRLNVELERIGDYAVSISRETVQLSAPPPAPLVRDIEAIAGQLKQMLQSALQSFQQSDAELARNTMTLVDKLHANFPGVFDDLLREGESRSRPVRDVFALLLIFRRLERVADQSKNICEEALFAATGEPKGPKTYEILFVDERNDCASQMAAAVGRRAFPVGARFDSAGWEPADRLQPNLVRFMERHGYDLSAASPKPVPTTVEGLGRYHVIVSLEGDVHARIKKLPFHTVAVAWDVRNGASPDDVSDSTLEAMHGEISALCQDLFELLHGKEIQ